MTRRSEFIAGLKDTLPLILAATPFGIIFGAQGISAGLSPAATMGMSLFVFAGSSQFIGALLVGQGTAIPVIVLTTFVVNLRHALYSASLAPYVKHLPQRWLVPLGFWLTDETYAITIRHYEAAGDPQHRHWYYFASCIFMYLNWNFWTLVGIIAGQRFEGIARLGLDFAMVVTFIGIVVPLLLTRPMLLSALVAGVTATLAYPLPNRLGLMIAALAGISAGLLAETLRKSQAETRAAIEPEAG
jgi:4-azaleucine resistance transporter AzlC